MFKQESLNVVFMVMMCKSQIQTGCTLYSDIIKFAVVCEQPFEVTSVLLFLISWGYAIYPGEVFVSVHIHYNMGMYRDIL